MIARCRDGFTTATYLAEQLVVDGVPFRSAHHQVGRAVLDAIEDGRPLSGETAQPAVVAAACDHGGGPGSTALDDLHRRLHRCRLIADRRRRRWRAAAEHLDAAVDALSPR
jgi:argininosuccinate lyase